MTTDSWTSLARQSYMTVTAHMIYDGILHHFVLETTEIKVNHTSENLLIHVQKVMKKFDLYHDESDVTVNCDNTVCDDNEEVDYLRYLGYYSDDEDEDEDEDRTTTHKSQLNASKKSPVVDTQTKQSSKVDTKKKEVYYN